MKVKELIEQLQSLDPELEVFIPGYEGGYENIERIGIPEDFVLNWHTDWYYGPHEKLNEIGYHVELKEKHKIVKGIIL